MYEKSKPFSPAHDSVRDAVDPLVARARTAPEAEAESARAGDALRALEWSELTARLNAARELRRELREEAILCAGSSGASFGDAAASFFKGLGQDERPVNPEDLEDCKASSGTSPIHAGAAAKGDARDTL
ncbi:MAG: hypothetical protein AAGH57_05195 [Pseudomonadota bacterium]